MISVIIPAYNEGDSIVDRVVSIKNTMEENGKDYEIIVMDDGSTDSTKTKIISNFDLDKHIRCFSYSPNMGKGYAVRKGFSLASGDLLAFIDADRDISPSHLIAFEMVLNLENADVVIGSKRHPGSSLQYPFLRRLYSNIYYYWVRVAFRLPVRDTQTGVKLFRQRAIEKILDKLKTNKFAFDLELLVLLKRAGFKILEAPIRLNFSRRHNGRISLKDVWSVFKDTISIFVRFVILNEDRKQ